MNLLGDIFHLWCKFIPKLLTLKKTIFLSFWGLIRYRRKFEIREKKVHGAKKKIALLRWLLWCPLVTDTEREKRNRGSTFTFVEHLSGAGPWAGYFAWIISFNFHNNYLGLILLFSFFKWNTEAWRWQLTFLKDS